MEVKHLVMLAISSPLNTALLLLLLLLTRQALQAIYRLYFHPLSKFPGPRQAALSYSWLHKLSKTGKAEQELEQLHKQYNTHALRTGPNELHLSDVSLYKKIYSQSKPFPKDGEFYDGFGTPHTLFAETDRQLHKERRRQLSPFFARSSLFKIEPVIYEHISALMTKLTTLSKQGKSISAHNAFRCVTVDIISEFAFAKSRRLVEQSNEEFEAAYLAKFDVVAEGFWDTQYSPNLRKIGELVPKPVLSALSTPFRHLFELHEDASSSVKAYRCSEKRPDHPVIFDGISELPDSMLSGEAINILIAGSDTTAVTLTTGVHRICQNPTIKAKLQADLKQAFPNLEGGFPSIPEIEALPYLVACVKESLRIAMPVMGRLPRIVPPNRSEPLIIDEQLVPAGTKVGLSAYTMHFSPTLFGPDARTFTPDRWLGEHAKGLDEYLVTFSKGARSCIGQNLALAELMLVFYALFRGFEVELERESEGELETRDAFSQAVVEPGLRLRMTPAMS